MERELFVHRGARNWIRLITLLFPLLLLITVGKEDIAWSNGLSSRNTGVYVEAEDYAASNFTSLPKSINGLYDKDCSGMSYLHLYFSPQKEKNLPELRRSIISPPGYLFLELPIFIEENGNYKNIWVSIAQHPSRFTKFRWTIFPKLDPPNQIVFKDSSFDKIGGSYGDKNFTWKKLDISGLDLNLKKSEGPYALLLSFDPNLKCNFSLDAVFLTTGNLIPQGPSQPLPPDYFDFINADSDYVLFIPSYLKEIYTNTLPKIEEISSKIEISLTHGEYEPVTLAIYPKKDLGQVTINISDLMGKQGIIPSETIKIFRVENLRKRWERQSPPEQNLLSPEYLYPSNQITCHRGETSAFWIIFKIDENTLGGIYKGEISLVPQSGQIKKIDIQVEVFPYKVQKYGKNHSMHYRNDHFLNALKGENPDWEIMEKEFQDILEHGCDGIGTAFGIVTSPKLYIPYNLFEKIVSLLSKTGYTNINANTIAISKIYANLIKSGMPSPEQLFQEIVTILESIFLSYNFCLPYFLVVDEIQGSSPDENRVQNFIELATLLKKDPGREHLIILTMTPWCVGDDPAEWPYYDPIVVDFVDFRSYNGWALDKRLPVYDFDSLSQDIKNNHNVLFGIYYNQHPAFSKIRFLKIAAGIYFWNTPVTNFATWTYKFWTGDPLDDLDGSSGDKMLAYPHPEDGSPMASLNWEAFREGVDDIRYITTLEHLIKMASDNDLPHILQAQYLIEEIRDKINAYGPHFRGIYAYMRPDDLKKMRKDLLEAIYAFYRTDKKGIERR